MAPIAFLLCWLFIAFLLVHDSRRRTSISAAVWIPTLVLVILSTRTPAGWLGIANGASGSGLTNDRAGNLVDQGFFALSILICWWIGHSRGVKWRKVLGANLPLTIFYAYFVLSVFWSDFPGDSLVRILKDFGCIVIVGAVILSEKEPLEAIRATYFRFACVVVPLSAVMLRYSSSGKEYAHNGTVSFVGAAAQKNSFGELLLVSVLFLVWDHMEDRRSAGKSIWSGMSWDRLLLLSMSLWLLKLSESATSMAVLVIALSLILAGRLLDSRWIGRIVLAGALAYPIVVLTTTATPSVFGPILALLGRDATFTGRADIWRNITWNTVNPWVGAGFWNFWGGPGGRAFAAAMRTDIPNAHDGYLDIYLDGGIIGVGLLSLMLLSYGRRLIKKLPLDRFNHFRFAFFIVMILHNVTESSFARVSALWFTTVLIMIDFPRLASQVSTASEESDQKVPEADWQRVEAPVAVGLATSRRGQLPALKA